MSDEQPPAASPKSNPETNPGEAGISADGHSIPADEMVEDRKRGANPRALARFEEQAEIFKRFQEQEYGLDALTALLDEVGTVRIPYRPTVMTRGDVGSDEYVRLNRIYNLLQAQALQGKRLPSAFGFGLHSLLMGIIKRGYVVTPSCRTATTAAYGYDDEIIDEFDIALAVVWSVSTTGKQILPDAMNARIPDLFAALGMDSAELT